MTITHKPLFRPEVLREKLRAFALPDGLDAAREKLARQAANLRRGHARGKESTLFPGFFADVFGELLGYVQPAQADAFRLPAGAPAPVPAVALHTFHPNFATATRGLADAAIGRGPVEGDPSTVIAVVEMKGPADPLDMPYGGRRLSAVEQGFGYAIDLGCDWIMVSSMVETRLYCKRADRL